VNIEQLKYMLAVAKHQNFTEASYEVSLSQSSLSKQIRNLEKELGGIDYLTVIVECTTDCCGGRVAQFCGRIIGEFESIAIDYARIYCVRTRPPQIGNLL